MIEEFASPEEVKELRQRAEELVEAFNPEEVSVFSTKAQANAFHSCIVPGILWR